MFQRVNPIIFSTVIEGERFQFYNERNKMYYAEDQEVYCEVGGEEPQYIATCDTPSEAVALADQLNRRANEKK